MVCLKEHHSDSCWVAPKAYLSVVQLESHLVDRTVLRWVALKECPKGFAKEPRLADS